MPCPMHEEREPLSLGAERVVGIGCCMADDGAPPKPALLAEPVPLTPAGARPYDLVAWRSPEEIAFAASGLNPGQLIRKIPSMP